jgi:hypothetical protein
MRTNKIITREQIYHIKKKFRNRLTMGRYRIREDGLVDVYGDFYMSNTQLKKLPFAFGSVSGNFHCSSNKLTSLKGSPSYIGGNFNCYGNNLKSLEGGPQEIGGSYSCHENHLKSLKGSPEIINGNFACFLNQLKSLMFGPINVNGSYYAYHNELITLEGSPDYVGGLFHVGVNEFPNLLGCPKVILDTLSFSDNVTSLFTGKRNCEVKRIEIQKYEGTSRIAAKLPQIIMDNQKYLRIVLKYQTTLSIWDGNINGNFSESDFDDIIYDIKDGLL